MSTSVRASVRASIFGGDVSVSNKSIAQSEKLQRAFEHVDAKTNALHKKLNLVYVALLGFVLIGLCALGCIIFGVVEIVGGDSIFGNDGFGEVLTVLGTYFSIPFVFVITLFLVITMDNTFSRVVGRLLRDHHQKILIAVYALVYCFQCTITNYYIAVLSDRYTLLIIIPDIIGLGLVVWYHRVDARGFIFAVLVFCIKLAIMWGKVWETVGTASFWGPNGIMCMLFLTVPMVELPLMASYIRRPILSTTAAPPAGEANALLIGESDGAYSNGALSPSARPDMGGYTEFNTPKNNSNNNNAAGGALSPPYPYHGGSGSGIGIGADPASMGASALDNGQGHGQGQDDRFTGYSARMAQMAEVRFVDHFVSHFGLYLNHVMHTLDLIAMFNFAFIAPATTTKQREAPLPFRVLIAILFCLGFFVNSASILHLFYNREDVHIANIPFIQPIIKAANRTMRAEGRANADLDPKMSYQRRLFQYMLLMLAVVDVPLLICRLELWAGQYAALSIFVAKNIKDVVDVAMLTLRVNENIRQNESGGGGGVGGLSTTAGTGAPTFAAPAAVVPVPIMREPSL